MKTFDIVVAADARLGIGKNGQLPWKLSKDMAYFKRVTSEVQDAGKRNAVIMGRITWDSIPPRFRPLDKRFNIVLTRQASLPLPEGVSLAIGLDNALEQAWNAGSENTFVIGGADVFAQAMHHPACRILYLTEIDHDFDCDTFLPDYAGDFEECSDAPAETISENGVTYRFRKLIKTVIGAAICLISMCWLPSALAGNTPADRGREHFHALNCSMCHPGGSNSVDPSKPLKGPGFQKKYPTDEHIAAIIRCGSTNGGMPAFRKDQLSDQQLVELIAFIRSLTPATKASPKPVPSKLKTSKTAPASSKQQSKSK